MNNTTKLALILATAAFILNASCSAHSSIGPDIVVSLRQGGTLSTNSFVLIDKDPNVITNIVQLNNSIPDRGSLLEKMGEAFDSCRVHPAGVEVKDNKFIFKGAPTGYFWVVSTGMIPYAGKKVFWLHPVTVTPSGEVLPAEIHLMLSNASMVEN